MYMFWFYCLVTSVNMSPELIKLSISVLRIMQTSIFIHITHLLFV